MKCPACGLEMFLYSAKSGEGGAVTREYVCGNKRCPRFDERMKRKTATAAEVKTTQEC